MQFKDITGQQDIKQRLIQTVLDNRISHAQLFLGKPGYGSLPLAVAYAQYICCENRQENDSCGTCPSCIKMNKLVHPDVHFVVPIALSKNTKTSNQVMPEWREAFLENPYLNLFEWTQKLGAENKQLVIGKDESANILHKLSLTSYESEYKVMIIWMPERMNLSCANKMLKILEEPPEKTLFLLISENEEQILTTILSRTQLVKISKIAEDDLKAALMEKQGISEQEALQTIALAEGSYTQALQTLQVNESAGHNFALFQEWMRICLRFNSAKVINWVNSMAAGGREQQKNFLHYALHIIRESLMVNYGDDQLVILQGDELNFVRKFAPFIHGGNCEKFAEELEKAYRLIERNANAKILFLDLSFKVNELLNIPVEATG